MKGRQVFRVENIDVDLLPDHGVMLGIVEDGEIKTLIRTDGSNGALMPQSIIFRTILKACTKPDGGFDNSGWAS